MESPRRLSLNENFNRLLTAFNPADHELDEVSLCLKNLEVHPWAGERFEYSGYAGEHWAVECGRFIIVYQFSSTELRPKEIRLIRELD